MAHTQYTGLRYAGPEVAKSPILVSSLFKASSAVTGRLLLSLPSLFESVLVHQTPRPGAGYVSTTGPVLRCAESTSSQAVSRFLYSLADLDSGSVQRKMTNTTESTDDSRPPLCCLMGRKFTSNILAQGIGCILSARDLRFSADPGYRAQYEGFSVSPPSSVPFPYICVTSMLLSELSALNLPNLGPLSTKSPYHLVLLAAHSIFCFLYPLSLECASVNARDGLDNRLDSATSLYAILASADLGITAWAGFRDWRGRRHLLTLRLTARHIFPESLFSHPFKLPRPQPDPVDVEDGLCLLRARRDSWPRPSPTAIRDKIDFGCPGYHGLESGALGVALLPL
ncbi:unnamed protein product [Protopolystoma xenopodis]|uniref:Uncharacterized protein n=1 Tax=Protopolystoma xenopodis TaxID=117903 RepID=A0A448WLY5_9PLAT|nr:unnamed protein product [Protopolystoma xenopodis]